MGKDNRRQCFRSKPYKKNNWRNHKQDQQQQRKENPKMCNRIDSQPKLTLRENQVFITEFTNPDLPGFTGILKSRFSDFHVNEIDTEGQVLELTETTLPIENKVTPIEPTQITAWQKEFELITNEKYWKDVADLSETSHIADSDRKVEIDVSHLDKEKRTFIHQIIKQLYKGKLVSTTISQQTQPNETGEEKKTIRIMKPKPGRGDNRWTFPAEYVTFLVHKTNIDTSEVAATLASRLNLRPSQVNYCGTKDKRAKTTQNFSIKHRSPKSISAAARCLRNVYIGNFKFQSTTLKLGDLQGNRFRIALRHIPDNRDDIEKALLSLRERGFINYYGLQRFGNSACVPTYQVGIALLKRDYKLACELILKPRDNDIEFMREIRKTWWENRDSKAAAAMFSNDKFIEKKLLDGLAKYGEQDYSAALRRIPRNMLLLYPHAYQSLIFNRIASKRIREFGLNLIAGDLIYVEDDKNRIDIADDGLQSSQVCSKEAVDMADSFESMDMENQEEVDSIFKRKVRPLTPEDIASDKYRLSDVVLPLPGYDITYPKNECGAWYEEMLQEVGLSSQLLRHKEKTYALGGAYRKLLIQPTDLKWEFRRHKTSEDTLIASDWEKLKNIAIEPEPTEEESKYTALLLEFSLPTAAYATMFLRELLKTDTSTATQIELERDALQKSIEEDYQGVAKPAVNSALMNETIVSSVEEPVTN